MVKPTGIFLQMVSTPGVQRVTTGKMFCGWGGILLDQTPIHGGVVISTPTPFKIWKLKTEFTYQLWCFSVAHGTYWLLWQCCFYVMLLLTQCPAWRTICRLKRDLKILDEAVLRKAVTSERAWVENATTVLKGHQNWLHCCLVWGGGCQVAWEVCKLDSRPYKFTSGRRPPRPRPGYLKVPSVGLPPAHLWRS